jgi:hypothetical protein
MLLWWDPSLPSQPPLHHLPGSHRRPAASSHHPQVSAAQPPSSTAQVGDATAASPRPQPPPGRAGLPPTIFPLRSTMESSAEPEPSETQPERPHPLQGMVLYMTIDLVTDCQKYVIVNLPWRSRNSSCISRHRFAGLDWTVTDHICVRHGLAIHLLEPAHIQAQIQTTVTKKTSQISVKSSQHCYKFVFISHKLMLNRHNIATNIACYFHWNINICLCTNFQRKG